MEPNVDRGMWSVVALLAAIVIGGVVLLAFPKISGKIANNMDDTVDKAFTGELPSWVDSQSDLTKQIEFLKDVERIARKHNPHVGFYSYFEKPKLEIHKIDKYNHKDWGISDASRTKYKVGKRLSDDGNVVFLKSGNAGIPKRGEPVYLFGMITNHSDVEIRVANHSVNKFNGGSDHREVIAPGETKFINIQGLANGAGVQQTTFAGPLDGDYVDISFYGLTPLTESGNSELLSIMEKHNIKKEI